MNRPLQILVFGVFVAVLAGCGGEGAGKLPATGTVNFEGKPLEHGFIVFELQGDKDAFRSSANVENGKFSMSQKDGLKPGTYIVRISSSSEAPKMNDNPGVAPPPAKERIPASWNSTSTNTVEAKSGSTNFTFDIK
jgi:hypothetical protein